LWHGSASETDNIILGNFVPQGERKASRKISAAHARVSAAHRDLHSDRARPIGNGAAPNARA
jgi:hypothetical protein